MKLADLFVSITVKGLQLAKSGLSGLQQQFQQTGKAAKQAAGASGTAGNPIPFDIRKIAGDLSQIRRPFTQLQRTLSKIGGEMGAGVTLATNMMRRAVAGQMQPVLASLQRKMIDHIATTHNWGGAQRLGAKAILEVHTAIGRFKERVAAMQELLGPFTNTARKGFFALTGAVTGFVTAGLIGTQEGNALALRFRFLAMQIAGVAMPVINRLINSLERLVNWFQKLSGAQQRTIARWTALTAAGLGFVALLPKILAVGSVLGGVLGMFGAPTIIGPILAIGAAIGGIVIALGEMGVFGDHLKSTIDRLLASLTRLVDSLTRAFGALWDIFGMSQQIETAIELVTAAVDNMVVTFNTLAYVLGFIADTLGDMGVIARSAAAPAKGPARTDVTPTASGFENFEQTFRRLQEQSLQSDFNKRTADATEQTAENTARIADALDGRTAAGDKPAFGMV